MTAPLTITQKSRLAADSTMIPATIHLDLDGARHIYRSHGWTGKSDDDRLFETGLRRALHFFDRAEVSATVFVIAEDLVDPKKRELLKETIRRGHDIASHSLTHCNLTALDSDAKRREIFESRERIAKCLGVEVKGFRAPGFNVDRQLLELIDEAGYSYDSSLFPNKRFAQRIGVTDVPESPHYPLEGRQLVELPLPSYTNLPLPFHPCYSLVIGTWYFRTGLRKFRRTGAPLVLLFHLTDFAEPLPQELLPKRMASLYTLSYIKGSRKRQRCQQMLDNVNQEYTIVETSRLLERLSTLQTDTHQGAVRL